MPPKKRGRPPMSGSTTPQPPIKRVRVGETSVIGTHSTVTDSGRPKRSSVGEPDYYSTKRPKSASAKHAEMEAATTPTKTSPTSTPTRKYKKKGATKLFGKRKASDTAKAEAETTEAAKPKRGRPKTVNALAKASVGKETTAAPKKTAGRPKKIVQNVKSTKPATGRGRPPKHVVNHDDEEEAEDDVAVANGTSNEVGEDEEDENADSGRQYWLMKAEPDSRIENGVDVKFSIDDLKSRNEAEAWDGVRNYVARNNMRAMRKGDLAFFYHSNCKVPGIAGVMRVVDEHRVDETAFDPNHPYYDPKSSRENPKWDVVFVGFVHKFTEPIKLTDLRRFAKSGGVLENMQLLKQGRLSVSVVKPKEWKFILGLTGEEPSQFEDEGDASPAEETLIENGVNGTNGGEGKAEENGDADEEGGDEDLDGEKGEGHGNEGDEDRAENGDGARDGNDE